jgi:hypothetical protein
LRNGRERGGKEDRNINKKKKKNLAFFSNAKHFL